MKNLWILSLIGILLIPSCSLSSRNSTVTRPVTVAYKSVQGVDPDLLSLDIHVAPQVEDAPVVLWVHGGGYAVGDKANQMADKISLFNGQGWILVSINYRLSTPAKGAAQFPDHYLDVAAAVSWVRDHIAEYGGDPNRIALLGHSAGADIVSNVAVNPIYFREVGLDLSVLTCAARLDTEGFDKISAGRDQPDGEQEQWRNALGNNPDYLTGTSATLLIQPNIGIPPMLVVTRGSERRQQIQTGFFEALQSAGIPAVLVDATSMTHNEVNSRIGADGDTVITPPLLLFLQECFD